MSALKIHFISGSDIERMALTDDEIVGAVEKSLLAQGQGQVVIEPREHLIPDPSFNGHFNILRGYIAPLDMAGVKVVGDYVDNYKVGLPSELALITLYDPRTGVPRAIVDCTEITCMRTGALTALGAKHLAKKKCKVLGHLGSRGTSWWNVVLLDNIFDFEEIRVNSRRPESRNDFAKRLSERLGKEVKAVETSEECLVGADIMVEATRLTTPEPLLKTEWVTPGTFVVPYGTISAVEFSLTDVMDKIVVDDWGQCKGGKFGSLRRHVDEGKLTEKTLHSELGEIVAGKKPGRENDRERILFWHRGLSLNDIALASLIYDKAREMGLGAQVDFH
ncbi:ornithine cyclodeaminase family protein [Fretibacterium sp. OH1220_COT-178]|uniref:ornithine cyclodeaminase family protein n=1 Tax=Fretibacterium sp. OH1220_COT-178 TaxID=2491047 RepID=UPI000F5DF641|nr:ornithine cyclodeaminase family protein [Fretibacterium sp. OH1220_COT-178]RRD64598.1 ornithine cyclodeaminase family protein [Fretibacterium sp. OH1220_COT-178]